MKEGVASLHDKTLTYSTPLTGATFKHVNVSWRLFGGCDWEPSVASPSAPAAPPVRLSVAGQRVPELDDDLFVPSMPHSAPVESYAPMGASPPRGAGAPEAMQIAAASVSDTKGDFAVQNHSYSEAFRERAAEKGHLAAAAEWQGVTALR